MTDIENMMDIYSCDDREAEIRLDMYRAGIERGIDQGRWEAQRFFQLALGLTEPNFEESAMWNNPVPLKATKDV